MTGSAADWAHVTWTLEDPCVHSLTLPPADIHPAIINARFDFSLNKLFLFDVKHGFLTCHIPWACLCSTSVNWDILPPWPLILAPRQGMKKWSEERNNLPTSVSYMPVHGEKGKVVGRDNFPLQLESWSEALFFSSPADSSGSSWSERWAFTSK